MGDRTGRIVIGRHGRRLVAARHRESVLVFGPPGSGKTSAFAIPTVLEWDGPAVVCSVTSEILHTTARVRSSHGRMAWVYDPTGTVGGVVSDLNRVYALDYGQWWPVDPIALAQSALGSSI